MEPEVKKQRKKHICIKEGKLKAFVISHIHNYLKEINFREVINTEPIS